jgi:hypothetical protein
LDAHDERFSERVKIIRLKDAVIEARFLARALDLDDVEKLLTEAFKLISQKYQPIVKT